MWESLGFLGRDLYLSPASDYDANLTIHTGFQPQFKTSVQLVANAEVGFAGIIKQ
jgi:hypothetical protein